MKNLTHLLTAALLLTGCASTQEHTYQTYLDGKGLSTPAPEHFPHCHGYGCKYIAEVTFTDKDWKDIRKSFKPAPKTAEDEREDIKAAIALFEQKAGAQTGTSEDHYGTFRKLGRFQHDCVDESTNTTVYLDVMNQQGLLRFHEPAAPRVRLPIVNAGRWPHQTATIREKNTQELFVVDSWFHDNGAEPEIVTLKAWKEGWKPERPDNSSDDSE